MQERNGITKSLPVLKDKRIKGKRKGKQKEQKKLHRNERTKQKQKARKKGTKRQTRKIANKSTHNIYVVHSQHSASVEERAIVDCFFDCQATGELFRQAIQP